MLLLLLLLFTANLPDEFRKVFDVQVQGTLTFSGSDESAVCNDAFDLHEGLSQFCSVCLSPKNYLDKPPAHALGGAESRFIFPPPEKKYHTTVETVELRSPAVSPAGRPNLQSIVTQ